MTNEVKNVPELRFPEFGGEWEEKSIGDLGSFYYGKSAPKWSITKDATIPCVRYGELYTKHKGIVREIYSYTNIDSNNLRFSEGGEILVPRVGEDPMDFAKCSYLPFSGIAIGEMISVYNTSQNPIFITTYFNSQMKYEFAKRVEGASVSNLYYSYLTNINMKIPTINEQQKIGDFFSKLDQQIELEEKKLAKLEEQKKGYMQQIFSQKLRFKDEIGNDYPNWEIEKLGDLINEVNERTISNNQYELLSSTKNGLLSQEEYFKKQIGSKDSTGYKILRLNQLVLSPQNLWLGNINFNQRFDIGIVSPSYRIYNLSHHFDINFAKDLLKSPRYIYEYAQASEQGASVVRRNLNLDLFYSIIISLPSIKEQRKIGSFLNKLDKLIEKQSSKIGVLKQRKKGFLQKMFV